MFILDNILQLFTSLRECIQAVEAFLLVLLFWQNCWRQEISCSLCLNVLHEIQEHLYDCMNLKHYDERMLRDNEYGRMMMESNSPHFSTRSDMCLISIGSSDSGIWVMALRRARLSLQGATLKNQKIPVSKEHLMFSVSLGPSTSRWWCLSR